MRPDAGRSELICAGGGGLLWETVYGMKQEPMSVLHCFFLLACIYTQYPSTPDRFFVHNDRQLISRRWIHRESYFFFFFSSQGELLMEELNKRGWPLGTSEDSSLPGISFSSLLLSEPWPYSLSFFLWARVGECGHGSLDHILMATIKEDQLFSPNCLKNPWGRTLAWPVLHTHPWSKALWTKWEKLWLLEYRLLCSKGHICSQMKMRSQKATPIWRTLLLQRKLRFAITSPIPLLLLLQHFVPVV